MILLKRLVFLLFAIGVFAGCQSEEPANQGAASPQPGESGAEGKVLRVGTNPDYPPMQLIDSESGEIVGYEVDLMEAVAQQAGYQVDWVSVEWKGIFGALERGDIDAIMSAATITEERQKKYNFSDPYHTISQRLVVRKEDAESIQEVSHITGNVIGVQLATTGALLVQEEYPEWETATFDNSSTAFADLAAGRIFGFMVDEPVADAYSRANPNTADRFAALPFSFSEENYGIVMRKGEEELLSQINEALKTIQDQGVDKELQAIWFQ